MRLTLLALLTLTLTACQQAGSTLSIGSGEDVIVYLYLTETEALSKVTFESHTSRHAVETLAGVEIIAYGFKCRGEGSVTICTYSSGDTLCQGLYVERGYRPRLTQTKDSLLVDEYSGGVIY